MQWTRKDITPLTAFCGFVLFQTFGGQTLAWLDGLRVKPKPPITLAGRVTGSQQEHQLTIEMAAVFVQVKEVRNLAKALIQDDTDRIRVLVKNLEQDKLTVLPYSAEQKIAALASLREQLEANERFLAKARDDLRDKLTTWYNQNRTKDLAEIEQSK